MQFGVGFQTHIERSPKHAALAERMGFDNAWFVDSQLIASDVYACLALAATQTSHITLGTGVAISDTRIPPVVAHSIATINQLAPGRVILGVGSGHTAWRAMGMPPVKIDSFRNTITICRSLLTGQTAEYSARGRQGKVRFMDTKNGYINIEDPIPIYLAASHPRAQKLAGELGDGVITLNLTDPQILDENLAYVKEGRNVIHDGQDDQFGVVTLGICCILNKGEALDTPRVLARVGPRIAVGLHYAYEQAKRGKEIPAFVGEHLTTKYENFLDRHWVDLHATHSRFLHPGEENFITPDVIGAMSLTGTRDHVLERLNRLEKVGLTQFVISPPWDFVEESMEEFSSQIISVYRK